DLIRDGEVLTHMLLREKVTIQELAAACREQGVADFADVRRAVLETNGTISVIPKVPSDAVSEQLNQMEATLRELLRRSDTELARQS
ncbi:MAG TPA: YetF domain-containing protein, partial [Thermomicrobiales bacterium]|nr:YetF domain-containing protein [Thermomicrobiales bacterium]